MLMTNVCLLISLDPNMTNITLLVVLKKPRIITFTTPPRTKCLLLIVVFFLEREFLSKKNSGSKVQLEEVRETQEMVSSS